MRARPIFMAAAVLVLLAACAPDTSAARSTCLDVYLHLFELANPNPTTHEYAGAVVEAATYCDDARAADPAKFLETYG